MEKELFKEKLNELSIIELKEKFCTFFNVNHVSLDLMDLVDETILKNYFIYQFLNDFDTFSIEDFEEIVGIEFDY